MNDEERPDEFDGLLQRLGQESEVRELCGLLFDFLMEQPLARFIDAERLLGHMDSALTEAVVDRVFDRHLRAWLEREVERTSDGQERLEDWFSEESLASLRALLARPVHLSRPFVENLVSQDAVRHLLRSLVEETLARFVDSLKHGKAGGLLGAAARGAKGITSTMTLGWLGKLGAQFEAALERAQDAFIEGSLDLMTRRTVDILTSPEMACRIAELDRSAFDAGMALSTHKAMRALERLPVQELTALVPSVVEHNLARDGFRSLVEVQISAIMEVEGQRTLGEILSETRSLGYWREQVLHEATPLVMEFSRTAPVSKWLSKKG